MPFTVDRNGRPIYPQIPFGFGAAMNAPYGKSAGDGESDDGSDQPQPPSPRAGYSPRPQMVHDIGSGERTWRLGGDSPVPMFWRKEYLLGLLGVLNAMHAPHLPDVPDEEDCAEQWDHARKVCEEELARKYPRRGRTGRFPGIEECARGWVSQLCGGDVVDGKRPIGPKKW